MTKYIVKYSSVFKKKLKIIIRRGKDINKLMFVVEGLANKEKLDLKYRNHILKDDNNYKNCGECHIEPDWLLVYQYNNDQLILYFILVFCIITKVLVFFIVLYIFINIHVQLDVLQLKKYQINAIILL